MNIILVDLKKIFFPQNDVTSLWATFLRQKSFIPTHPVTHSWRDCNRVPGGAERIRSICFNDQNADFLNSTTIIWAHCFSIVLIHIFPRFSVYKLAWFFLLEWKGWADCVIPDDIFLAPPSKCFNTFWRKTGLSFLAGKRRPENSKGEIIRACPEKKPRQATNFSLLLTQWYLTEKK